MASPAVAPLGRRARTQVFDDLPLIDGHAHPMQMPEVTGGEPFARYFSEAHDPETLGRHAPNTLFYRQALRDLAGFLGCEAKPDAVMTARTAQPLEVYMPRLLGDARVELMLIDDGYPREHALSVAEMGVAGNVRARRVLRIERVIEDLIGRHNSISLLVESLTRELEAARGELAALKSVIAYRSGLAIEPTPAAAAERAFTSLRAAGGGGLSGAPRLTSKPLLDYLVPLAAEWAAGKGLPLQLHTGFGDRDLDLRLANPLHLRPLLEHGALSQGPLVLLHAAYPYVREAGYLASVYPNVYVDLSQVTPLLAGPGLTRVIEELLALAPVTKILYGSDAWGIPEWFWLGARAGRRALTEALRWQPDAEARWAARRILHDNAAELYGAA